MPKAIDGIDTIRSHLSSIQSLSSSSRPQTLELMPGSGINLAIARQFVEQLAPLGLCSLHLSGGKLIQECPKCPSDGMMYRREGMGMGVSCSGDNSEEWSVWRTSSSQIYAVRQAIDEALEALKKSHSNPQ